MNQGSSFGKIKVVNEPVSFDVKPDIADPTLAVLKFTRDDPTRLTLKNGDAASYLMECSYAVGKVTVPCKAEQDSSKQAQKQPSEQASATHINHGAFKVASRGDVTVLLTPDPRWFQPVTTGKKWDSAGALLHFISQLLKESTADGQLTIKMRSIACSSDPAAPVKTFRFKSSLAMYSEETREFWGFLIVFIILLLGSLFSVLANLLLPGAARRLKVKEGLAVVSRKISDLSMDLDSRIRVPLGVERARLSMRLQDLGTISPDFSVAITEIEKEVAKLITRLDIIEKMDLGTRLYWKMRREGRLPFSLTEQIEDIRQQMTDVLARSEPNDTDLQNVQLLIQDMEKRLTGIDQPNPALAQQLVARIQNLQRTMPDPDAGDTMNPTLKSLKTDLPGLFARLYEAVPRPEDIKPTDYADLDALVQRLLIVNRYYSLEKNFSDNAGNMSEDDEKRRENTQRSRLKLISLLRQSQWNSLNEARSLIQKLEENVFAEDVMQEVIDNRVIIDRDRPQVYQYDPTGFRLLFLNKAIGNSTARREFTIKWNFGDGLTERGGWVSHYFLRPTKLTSVTSLNRIVRRLILWPAFIYLFVLLLMALFMGIRNHIQDLFLIALVVLFSTSLVIIASPLSFRFWKLIKKKRNASQVMPETAAEFLRVPYILKASLTTPDGKVTREVWDELDVLKSPRTKLPASFWVEATRIAIALLIALAGLVAGAKDQLQKLDTFPALIAIFLIGFGANEIKKLFSQNPQG